MSNNVFLDRLEGINIRFEEVGQLITDPDIISDMKILSTFQKKICVLNLVYLGRFY